MSLADILVPERVAARIEGENARQVLMNIANFLAAPLPGITGNELYHYLSEREKKGSTALGGGVAIPHCRIVNCPGEIGALFTLQQPIDFNASDGQKVDLMCVLLVPEQDDANEAHLRVLALLVNSLGDEELCRRLRTAEDDRTLYQLALGSSNE